MRLAAVTRWLADSPSGLRCWGNDWAQGYGQVVDYK